MSDHVHIFISTNQTFNLSKIINILKGYSSYFLRKTYDKLLKYKSLWTNSYFCESIGHTIQCYQKYIKNQKYHT